MSINVDKMDSKHDDTLQKSKPSIKRRKKNISNSEVSHESRSPKKHITNGFADEILYSPEITSYSSFHNILPDQTINSPNSTLSTLSNSSNYEDSNKIDSISQSPIHSIAHDDSDNVSIANKNRRQPRTPEDFYLFCQFILEYANYNEMCNQESLRKSTHSPLDSTGSATESTTSSGLNDESNHAISNGDLNNKELHESNAIHNTTDTNDVTKTLNAIDATSANEDDDSEIDADSYNLITCYCGKPYAARPMIECSQCLTWLHLSCAKIKRKNIPDIFICVKCAKPNGQGESTIQSSHPKDLQSNEPKENNRSKKSNASQTRSDKIESILQPLNVSTAYEAGANNLENIKTPTVSSIAVKYK